VRRTRALGGAVGGEGITGTRDRGQASPQGAGAHQTGGAAWRRWKMAMWLDSGAAEGSHGGR
jgi:hypothetical protein